MRRSFLTPIATAALTMLLASTAAQARHVYQPLVKEGKTWKYIYRDMVRGSTLTPYCPVEFTITGDTVINEVEYKKIITIDSLKYGDTRPRYFAAIAETDRVVNIVYGDSTESVMLFDFNVLDDSYTDPWQTSVFTLWKYEMAALKWNKGRMRSIVDFIPFLGEYYATTLFTLYEGIGWCSQGFHPFFDNPVDTYQFYYFKECYEDGELVFDEDDWRNGWWKENDVNGDERIDIDDLNQIVNEILGKTAPDVLLPFDIDGSGTTDIDDVNYIVNAILGKTK